MRIHATASRPGDEPAASTARARGPISPEMGNMQGESKAQPSKVLLLISVILVLAMGLQSQSRPGRRRDADAVKMDPVLESMRNRGALRQERVPVIIQFTDRRATGETAAEAAYFDDEETGKDDRRRIVAESGGNPYEVCEVMPFVAAEVDQESLARLSSDSRVAHVSLDYPVAGSLQTSDRAVGADQVWVDASRNKFFDGSGITIAIIDSGIADDRALNLSSKVAARVDFVANASAKGYLADPYGHGTHVAGIAAGTGSFSGGKYNGIAPGAKVMDLRVLDGNGQGLTSNVIRALDYCVQKKASLGIRVINLSLGHPPFESYQKDPLCQAVERCVQAGIVVVVAAGNNGKGQSGTVWGGIASPANDPLVITVGAADTKGTVGRGDDVIAGYSSRGPTAVDGLIKPDIVAPGNKVIANAQDNGILYNLNPGNRVQGSRPKDKYFTLSGTSMAAPMVAGAVALMLQANPSLQPNTVKLLLGYTAEKMTQPHILEQGNGYLNTEGAVRLARAISQNSAALRPGDIWIADAKTVGPASTMIDGKPVPWGQGVIWGDGILWGEGVLWGDGVLWGEGVLWGDGILWGEGVLWGDHILIEKQAAMVAGASWGSGEMGPWGVKLNGSALWHGSAKVGAKGLCGATSGKWFRDFVDPSSVMRNLSQEIGVLVNGDNAAPAAVIVGPPGAWFYPKR